MRIVVTGGSGYLGRVLVQQLLSVGHKVVNVDRQLYSVDPLQHPNLEQVVADVRLVEVMESIFVDPIPDALVVLSDINMGNAVKARPSMARWTSSFNASNLAMAEARGVPIRILGSSATLLDKSSETAAGKDDGDLHLFGLTDYESELIVSDVEKAKSFSSVLRFPYLYGWSPRMRFDTPINMAIASAKANGIIPVWGDDKSTMPVMSVRDAAMAIKLVLDKEKSIPGIFNLIGHNVMQADLASGIRRYISDAVVSQQPDDTCAVKVDGEKFDSMFGFKPSFNVHDGIREVITGLTQNPMLNWIDPIYHNDKMLK
jgi:nucleoside-diphosphate-sugar epimerase